MVDDYMLHIPLSAPPELVGRLRHGYEVIGTLPPRTQAELHTDCDITRII